MLDFYSLHNHTEKSNIRMLDCINKPKDLVNRALELNYKGIALTDHECLSAAVDFLKIRDKVKQKNPDFKFIFGNEIYLIPDELVHKNPRYYHFILLAKDLEGWKQLKELSSRAWERSYMERGLRRCPTFYSDLEEIIGKNQGHILAQTACFTKGHKVKTTEGYKNIEDIKAGDKVFTLDGTVQEVLSPTFRDYKGEGSILFFNKNKENITCTANHKFLVSTKVIKKDSERKLKWVEAKDLVKGDLTLDLFPTYSYSKQNIFNIEELMDDIYYKNQSKYVSNFSHILPSKITITPEIMRLYGLWLGDGSVASLSSKNPRRCTLSFNEKEFDSYYPFVLQALKQLGLSFEQIHIRNIPENHKKEIVISSVEIASLLRYISNDGKSDTKFIYPKLKHISKELDIELLYGYLLADGYYRKRKVKKSEYYSEETVDTTISKQLFEDITELYYSAGFIPSVYYSKEKTDKNGVHHKKAYYHSSSCSFFSEENNKTKILDHKSLISNIEKRSIKHLKGKGVVVNGVKYQLKTVKANMPTYIDEKVYCLNVANNHSFICNGIIVHNCLGGELSCDILAHKVPEANAFVRWCMSVFGKENFALEIQPSDSEEQIKVNQVIVKLANHYNLPYVVTTDSHYLYKEDFKIHSAFLNSKASSDRETEKFYKYTYLMSVDEIISILTQGGLTQQEAEQAILNTGSFTATIEDFDFRSNIQVPVPQIPDFKVNHDLKNWYDEFDAIKTFAYSPSIQDQYLLYLIEEGLKEKNIPVSHTIASRINEELDVVKYISDQLKQSVAAYLNLVKIIVDICWEVSFVGAGRGSAGCFYISYLVGITQTNPLEYNIPSFRFLNKARADAMPDIDLDISPTKTQEVFALLQKHFGINNVINCATFKTESLKAAILTAAKGLGYNNDDASALTLLVPSKRGITYSLNDCLYGNEEKGYEPVPNFEDNLRKFPGLFEAVERIEGLSMNPSIHASAVYIFTNGYLEMNSFMRAPNGTPITAFNMHDSDDMGALKFDLLRTDAESKLMKGMDLLLKDGAIKWQGSLRATYDQYFHPQRLVYDIQEMWDNLSDGVYNDIFQLDTGVGQVALKRMRPSSVAELATVNGLIRLQTQPGQQSPIERYVTFKNNISLWYKEMEEANLSKEQQAILEKHVLDKYGIAYSQEDLMRILMDPQIANFTLKEADKARKIIAKKQINDIEKLKEHYFESGSNDDNFKNYVWNFMISPQLGYSFNLAHGVSYSLIALQELNMAYCYNSLYWNCACLCINSGSNDTDFEEDSDEGDIEETAIQEQEDMEESEIVETSSTTTIKTKYVAPDYGKIAKAISDAQLKGINIELPDINKSQADFIPDIKSNSILYGLLAINVVNPELFEKISQNRPYSSLFDFIDKVQPTFVQTLGLIKTGCFDRLEGVKRQGLINAFLEQEAKKKFPIKAKLTSSHINKALDMGMDLQEYANAIKLYKYKKYIDKNQYNSQEKRYILTEEVCQKFFKMFIEKHLDISKSEYGYLPDSSIFVKKTVFEKTYKNLTEDLINFLNTEEGRQAYANFEQRQYIKMLKEKYCQGTLASWEMETLSFYHEPHEFSKVNNVKYNIRNFETLPEKPADDTDKTVYCLAGTVIKTENTKHIVSISTIYGVVNVKFYAKLYSQFNQKISLIDETTKKKTVIDESWFKRGTKIIVYGQRRDNLFMIKTDYSTGYARTVGLVENIDYEGNLDIRYKRNKK